VALACHHIPDIVDKIVGSKGNQVILCHKVADGHTLVNQAGRCVGIVGRGEHGASPLLGQLFNGHGHARSLADNNAAGFHLNGAQLGFIAVSQNHQIVLLNVILHHVRIGGCYQHLSLIKVGVLIAYHQSSLQSLQNIGILGAGLGENAAVVDVHVGSGNVSYCDQPLQDIVLCHSRQSHHRIVLHQIPGLFQGNILLNARCLPDLNILHLSPHVFNKLGGFHSKIVQYVLCLRIDVAGSGRGKFLSCQDALQIGVADGRTDGIRIWILMSNDNGFSLFAVAHMVSSAYVSYIVNMLFIIYSQLFFILIV